MTKGLPVENCGIQQVVEEFTGTTPGENTGKNAITQRNLIKTDEPSEKKRKTCATMKCHNRTTDLSNSCRGMVCEKCAVKFAQTVLIKCNNNRLPS